MARWIQECVTYCRQIWVLASAILAIHFNFIARLQGLPYEYDNEMQEANSTCNRTQSIFTIQIYSEPHLRPQDRLFGDMPSWSSAMVRSVGPQGMSGWHQHPLFSRLNINIRHVIIWNWGQYKYTEHILIDHFRNILFKCKHLLHLSLPCPPGWLQWPHGHHTWRAWPAGQP